MAIVAINEKYQRTVDRYLYWNDQYNVLVDSGKEDSKAGDKAFDKLSYYFGILPKREQRNIKSLSD